MSATTVRLWHVRDSAAARRYCKVPKSRNPGADVMNNVNYVWVPLSLVEHATRYPSKDGVEWPEHHVKLPDWFVEKEKL